MRRSKCMSQKQGFELHCRMLGDSGDAVMLHRSKVPPSLQGLGESEHKAIRSQFFLVIHTEYSYKLTQGCCEVKQANRCIHS